MELFVTRSNRILSRVWLQNIRLIIFAKHRARRAHADRRKSNWATATTAWKKNMRLKYHNRQRKRYKHACSRDGVGVYYYWNVYGTTLEFQWSLLTIVAIFCRHCVRFCRFFSIFALTCIDSSTSSTQRFFSSFVRLYIEIFGPTICCVQKFERDTCKKSDSIERKIVWYRLRGWEWRWLVVYCYGDDDRVWLMSDRIKREPQLRKWLIMFCFEQC